VTFRASWSRASTSCPNGQPQCASQIVSNANVLVLRAQAGGVTYDGLNIDGRGGRPADQVFEAFSGNNITVRNSRIGNIVDGKGAMTSRSGLVYDNVYFHDVIATNSNVHNECIQTVNGTGSVDASYLRSEFRNCATMDASIGFPSWHQPPPPPWHTLRIEDSIFGCPRYPNNQGCHAYGLALWATQAQQGNDFGVMHNFTIRNNWFESGGTNRLRRDGTTVTCGNYGPGAASFGPAWTAPC
jgi:hypothetical protein